MLLTLMLDILLSTQTPPTPRFKDQLTMYFLKCLLMYMYVFGWRPDFTDLLKEEQTNQSVETAYFSTKI